MAILHTLLASLPPPSSSSPPPSSSLPSPPTPSLISLPLLPSLSFTSPDQNSHFRRSFLSHGLLALLGSFTLQGLTCDSGHAFSLGISGPKDWLKGQKKKTADFLLAPVIASRDRLRSALLLTTAETASSDDFLEAQNLVKVAARDCIRPEDGSFIAFQVKTGVEVCTFRLILKNAASLLDDSDPIKLNADAALLNLISSFTSLDGLLSNAFAGSSVNRDNVADAFSQTTDALDTFEKGVRDCLGIA